MICKKCKNEINEGENFCSNCGKKIKSTSQRKKLIFIIIPVIIIVIVVGIAIIIKNKNISTEENEVNYNNTTNLNVDDQIENSTIDEETNFVKQDIKYITNISNDLLGLGEDYNAECYIIFKDKEYELNTNMKMDSEVKQNIYVKIKGTYFQDNENINFTITSSEITVEVDEIKESKDLEEIEQEILYGKVSNNGRTITLIGEDEKELVFEQEEGREEEQEEQKQTTQANPTKTEKEQIGQIIDAYAKITTKYDGYDLQYMGNVVYARDRNGKDVYMLRYLAKSYGVSVGLEYCRLVSLDSTNTMIDKKSEFCKWGSMSGAAQSSPLLKIQYKQIWGD